MATWKQAPQNGKASLELDAKDGAVSAADGEAVRRPAKIATVSHTLDADLAEWLRYLAFHERISESAIIEFALRTLRESGNDASLGDRLRVAGAALRRKS